MKSRGLLKDIVTDYDNETYDTGRVLAVVVVLAMVVMQGWAVWKSGTFVPSEFGTGVAAVIAALGVAIFGDNAKRPGNDRQSAADAGHEGKATAGAAAPAADSPPPV